MSPEEKAERKRQRDLKANNVQRRRFEKLLKDDLAPRARTLVSTAKQDNKELVEQRLILTVLDGSLERLMEIRSEILKLRAEANEIAEEAKQKGLSADNNRSYGRSEFDFYVDPRTSDLNADACVKPGIIDHLRGFTVRRCPANPIYQLLERKLEAERGRDVDLQFDVSELSQNIWGLPTTTEIMEKIESFKQKWITFDAGMED
jgi:hypothetical protein